MFLPAAPTASPHSSTAPATPTLRTGGAAADVGRYAGRHAPMRVLAFDEHPSSKRGGQELGLFDEAQGLLARGHALTLGYVRDGDLLTRYRAAGARIVRLRALRVNRRNGLRPFVDFATAAVQASLQPADVVVVNQYQDAALGAAVAAARRVPLVCHLRLDPPEVFSRQWLAGLRRATHFIAVSEYTGRAWADGGIDPRKIWVVHDGIDMDRFAPSPAERGDTRRDLGIPADAFLALYVGRLDRWKKLEAMLDVFATLAETVAAARLLVAGAPVDHPSAEAGAAYVAELEGRARRLGIAERVRWLGPREDVPRLLNAADVTLLFSRGESFGRATVESLACGVPAVATRQGGGGEILSGEFARLTFDAARPGDALPILRSLVGWQRHDPDFAIRARRHVVNRYDKAAMVDGVEQVLSAVTGRAGRASAGSDLALADRGAREL